METTKGRMLPRVRAGGWMCALRVVRPEPRRRLRRPGAAPEAARGRRGAPRRRRGRARRGVPRGAGALDAPAESYCRRERRGVLLGRVVSNGFFAPPYYLGVASSG